MWSWDVRVCFGMGLQPPIFFLLPLLVFQVVFLLFQIKRWWWEGGGLRGSTCDHIRDFFRSETPKVQTGLNFVSSFLKTPLTEGKVESLGFCLQLLCCF